MCILFKLVEKKSSRTKLIRRDRQKSRPGMRLQEGGGWRRRRRRGNDCDGAAAAVRAGLSDDARSMLRQRHMMRHSEK
eukprot:2475949-Pleurochrysis_carterae.AAC.3